MIFFLLMVTGEEVHRCPTLHQHWPGRALVAGRHYKGLAFIYLVL